jgi:hypothetical protein
MNRSQITAYGIVGFLAALALFPKPLIADAMRGRSARWRAEVQAPMPQRSSSIPESKIGEDR